MGDEPSPTPSLLSDGFECAVPSPKPWKNGDTHTPSKVKSRGKRSASSSKPPPARTKLLSSVYNQVKKLKSSSNSEKAVKKSKSSPPSTSSHEENMETSPSSSSLDEKNQKHFRLSSLIDLKRKLNSSISSSRSGVGENKVSPCAHCKVKTLQASSWSSETKELTGSTLFSSSGVSKRSKSSASSSTGSGSHRKSQGPMKTIRNATLRSLSKHFRRRMQRKPVTWIHKRFSRLGSKNKVDVDSNCDDDDNTSNSSQSIWAFIPTQEQQDKYPQCRAEIVQSIGDDKEIMFASQYTKYPQSQDE